MSLGRYMEGYWHLSQCVCMSSSTFVHLYICLYIHTSVHMSVMSVGLWVCLYICMSLHMGDICVPACQVSMCPYLHPQQHIGCLHVYNGISYMHMVIRSSRVTHRGYHISLALIDIVYLATDNFIVMAIFSLYYAYHYVSSNCDYY